MVLICKQWQIRVCGSAHVESTFLMTNSPQPFEVRVKSEPVKFTVEELQASGSLDSHRIHFYVDERDNCQVSDNTV